MSPKEITTNQKITDELRTQALKYCQGKESVTREDIRKHVGLSMAMIGHLISELLDTGALVLCSNKKSTRYMLGVFAHDPWEVHQEWMPLFTEHFTRTNRSTAQEISQVFSHPLREVAATLEEMRRQGKLTGTFVGSICIYALTSRTVVRTASPEELAKYQKPSRKAALPSLEGIRGRRQLHSIPN